MCHITGTLPAPLSVFRELIQGICVKDRNHNDIGHSRVSRGLPLGWEEGIPSHTQSCPYWPGLRYRISQTPFSFFLIVCTFLCLGLFSCPLPTISGPEAMEVWLGGRGLGGVTESLAGPTLPLYSSDLAMTLTQPSGVAHGYWMRSFLTTYSFLPSESCSHSHHPSGYFSDHHGSPWHE